MDDLAERLIEARCPETPAATALDSLSRCGRNDALPSGGDVTPAIEIRILEYNDNRPIDATTNSSPRIGAKQVARYRRDLQSVFNAIVLRPPRCTALTKSERDPSTPDSTIGWWIHTERLRNCTAHRCVTHDSYLEPRHLQVLFQNLKLETFDAWSSMNSVRLEAFRPSCTAITAPLVIREQL